MIYYLVVLVGVFACSASQLLLKKSAQKKFDKPWKDFLNWRVIVSYTIMFVTLLTNIYAMNHGVMLKDLPILEATGYIFVPVLSMLVLREKMDGYSLIAMLFIVMGILIFYI